MVKKVLKFGGTSVGTIDRIQHVANIIKKEHIDGNKVIAVVSAMAGKTNELIKLSRKISDEFIKRNYAFYHLETGDLRIARWVIKQNRY